MNLTYAEQIKLINEHRSALVQGADNARIAFLEMVLYTERQCGPLSRNTTRHLVAWGMRVTEFKRFTDRDNN